MLDHIGLAVTDLAKSRAFYEAALEPLGIPVLEVIDENEAGGTAVMMGDSEPFFVFADNEQPGEGTHVAFRAANRAGRWFLSGGDGGGRQGQWRAGHQGAVSSGLLCGVCP
jgi:catechol 2,3-dioxygenase-like lactoylglutathione lyase family enzyme